MEDFIFAFSIVFTTCVVLPIMIVWFTTRYKTNQTNRQTEIILAAIEKNSTIDIEDFFKKMNPPSQTLKQGLIKKLTVGCVMTAGGIAFLIYSLWLEYFKKTFLPSLNSCYLIGILSLFVGGAYLFSYIVSKKMLAKELKAEERQMEEAARPDNE